MVTTTAGPPEAAPSRTAPVAPYAGWRWDEKTAARAAGVVSVVLALAAASLTAVRLGSATAAVAGATVALPALAGGALLSRSGRRAAGVPLLDLGGSLLVLACWFGFGGVEVRLVAVGAALAAVVALLGWCTDRLRTAVLAAGAVLAGAVLWAAALAVVDAATAGVVLGALSVLVLGVVPRLALASAGLTRWHVRRPDAATVRRHEVDTALAVTHRELAPVGLVAAVSATAGGWLALDGAAGWGAGYTLLVALLLVSRCRAYPLTVEVLALLAGATLLVVRVVAVWSAGTAVGPLVALGALALLPLVPLAAPPAARARRRARQVANLAESAAVVLLLPVALGVCGLYDRFVDSF
ncbi:secretion protein snm4 [Streptomyces durbertensis]|uniref:Secretion protein snm4 n=1 Tax=Streptomyces durbertensis TaxID=2448886 RepID=A0ABR6EMT8_9ACTN|nr:secretion protein snm4 [Streptomyces durbertensis]MBB1246670.1 secretion protein snm4 [Streptomyces durbertensis]